jgi:hypothetical protein
MIRALPLLLLAGCPGSVECEGGTPTVELGTGDLDYQPLAEGGALDVFYGMQGGIHVYGSVHVTALAINAGMTLNNPDTPKVTFQVLDEGGAILGGYAQLPRVFRKAGEQWELVGEQLILDYELVSDGQPVTLRFEAIDACGVTAEASVGAALRMR